MVFEKKTSIMLEVINNHKYLINLMVYFKTEYIIDFFYPGHLQYCCWMSNCHHTKTTQVVPFNGTNKRKK